MESLLGGLFGGQDADDQPRHRARAEDFVNRYEQGAPWDNISDEEALHNYQAVAGRLSPEEMEDSAAEAYARLSPQERRHFAEYLQQRGGAQLGPDDYDDPRQLARATSRYQAQQPEGLAGLLGGGGGLSSMLGGALGGGGSQGAMLQGPIGKAVMGGIAAMAMKKMMGR
jgi:hypothetical protein